MESMACPEKWEEPYYGIYLFEMYRHIFFSSYHIESIKKLYTFDPQLYGI